MLVVWDDVVWIEVVGVVFKKCYFEVFREFLIFKLFGVGEIGLLVIL